MMPRAPALAEVLPGTLKGNDAREGAAGAPDAAAEAGELDDLRVVDEKVRARALVLDVVREDVRVRGFEPSSSCLKVSPSHGDVGRSGERQRQRRT